MLPTVPASADSAVVPTDWISHWLMTRHCGYALGILIYLGLNSQRRCTTQEIADAYGIARRHLIKPVHELGQNGFITTNRGKSGGLELARPSSDINLGGVFRSLDKNFRTAERLAEQRSAYPIAGFAVLAGVLEDALQAFLDVLDRHTLETLLESADPSPDNSSG